MPRFVENPQLATQSPWLDAGPVAVQERTPKQRRARLWKRVALTVAAPVALVVQATPVVQQVNRMLRLGGGYYAEQSDKLVIEPISTRRTLKIAALGDSTMAGTGAGGGYDPSSVISPFGPGCFQADTAPATLAAKELGADMQMLACSGEDGPYVEAKELPLLDPETDIVFAAWGANGRDGKLSFLQTVSSCMSPSLFTTCESVFTVAVNEGVPKVGQEIYDTLINVRSKLNKQSARIIFVWYTDVLPNETSMTSWCDPMRDSDLKFLKRSYETLRREVQRAVNAAGAEFYDSNEAFTDNERACQDGSLIQDVTPWTLWVNGTHGWPYMHLTADGNRKLANSLADYVRRTQPEPPPPMLDYTPRPPHQGSNLVKPYLSPDAPVPEPLVEVAPPPKTTPTPSSTPTPSPSPSPSPSLSLGGAGF